MAIQFVTDQLVDSVITTAKLANTSITPGKLDLGTSTNDFDFSGCILKGATQSGGDNSTKVATTAFVQQEIAGNQLTAGAGIAIDTSTAPDTIAVSLTAASSGLTFSATGNSGTLQVVLDSSSGLQIVANRGMALDLNGLPAASEVAVADDLIAFIDGGISKKVTIGTFNTAIAGAGLGVVSNQLVANVDDSSLEINSDNLQVKALGITNAMLAGSIADSKLSQITTSDKVAGSAVELAGSGGLENDSGLKISDSGVTNAMLAGSIANAKLANSTISGVALGSNLNSLALASNSGLVMTTYNGSAAVSDLKLHVSALAAGTAQLIDEIAIDRGGTTQRESLQDIFALAAGNGLAVSSGVLSVGVDGSSLEIDSDALRVKALGIATSMLANLSITEGKIAAAQVSAAKMKLQPKSEFLAQSDSVSSAGVTYALAQTVPTNFGDAVIAFRNGQRMQQVATAGAVDDNSKYFVNGIGGSSQIICNSGAFGSTDILTVDYLFDA